VKLEGDPSIIAPIRIELGGYGDPVAPCIAVQVTCHGNGTEVQIELRDELGRTSQRWFASPSGAAAFIVSWSQRPLSGGPPGMALAPAPSTTITAAPGMSPPQPAPSRDRPWHPELELSYVNASDIVEGWVVASAAVMRQTAFFRYGVALRGITDAKERNYRALEGDLALGVTSQLAPRWSLGLDLLAGGTLGIDGGQLEGDYGANGPRVAVRASLGLHILSALELQLALGYDLMRRNVLVSGSFPSQNAVFAEHTIGFAHVDAGIRWSM
jgi:hypothetical protein